MSKENLFKYIRKEEVVLWAGAGLSKYAGYPLGAELTNILYDELSANEKEIIPPNLSLSELANNFQQLKNGSRHQLLKLIEKIFVNTTPTSIDIHRTISNIPHFQTIITTNYDRLFEIAYGTKAKVVYNPSQVPYLEKDKVEILKIHGDINDVNSIILTKSDYDNFFKDDYQNNPLWTIVRERFISKCILFIGYSLEDSNVAILFDKICESLKSHQREVFFVSPNLPQHKVIQLAKKNIQYINCTAEELFESLVTNIKENIVRDFENKTVSTESFSKFFKTFNLQPTVELDNNSNKIKSIRGLQSPVKYKIHLNFNDNEVLRDLNKFITGKSLNDFLIHEESIKKSKLTSEGIKISDGFAKLKFTYPGTVYYIDIVFDNGHEFNNLKVEVKKTPYLFQLTVDLVYATLTIFSEIIENQSEVPPLNFTFTHHEFCGKVTDELKIYEFLYNFSKGINFKIYTQNGNNYNYENTPVPILQDEIKNTLQHFKNLQLIESHTKKRFNIRKMDEIEDNFEMASLIAASINNVAYISECAPTITFNVQDIVENFDAIMANLEGETVTFEISELENVILHGVEILLKHLRMDIFECYISNKADILSRKDCYITIKSRSERAGKLYATVE